MKMRKEKYQKRKKSKHYSKDIKILDLKSMTLNYGNKARLKGPNKNSVLMMKLRKKDKKSMI